MSHSRNNDGLGRLEHVGNGNGHKRQYRSSRRHFDHGVRAAAARAFTGACLYVEGDVTLGIAAMMAGSNPRYVEAAVAILKAEDTAIVRHVLAGQLSLLAAAEQIHRRANLVAAYRAASADDLLALGRVAGPSAIWDSIVAPNV
jgi:hypothetical protein